MHELFALRTWPMYGAIVHSTSLYLRKENMKQETQNKEIFFHGALPAVW
jgi:hypothetical protein